MNTKLIEKINKEIQDKDLKPTPRIIFQMKNFALWIPGILSIIIGALAVSSLIFGIDHGGLRFAPFIDAPFIVVAMKSLPYVWMLLSAVSGYIAFRSLRITRHGYQYRVATLVLASLLLSVVLGGAGYVVGIGRYIDMKVEQLSPQISALGQQQALWHNPEHGRLAGTVRKVHDEFFTVRDISGDTWLVTIDQVFGKDKVIFNALVDKNNKVRVMGYVDPEIKNTFHACFVAPLFEPRIHDDMRPLLVPPPVVLGDVSESCRDVLQVP